MRSSRIIDRRARGALFVGAIDLVGTNGYRDVFHGVIVRTTVLELATNSPQRTGDT